MKFAFLLYKKAKQILSYPVKQDTCFEICLLGLHLFIFCSLILLNVITSMAVCMSANIGHAYKKGCRQHKALRGALILLS